MPSGLSTRPTADRARGGLFSSLLPLLEIKDARDLDLHAGYRAPGLEAASRGAAGVTLVENDPHAVAVLRANVALLALPGTCVVAQPIARFLKVDPARRYDLALLDPPYELEVAPVLTVLHPWLADDAVVAVERRTRGPELTWPPGYAPVRSRRYGEATLWYAIAVGEAAPTARLRGEADVSEALAGMAAYARWRYTVAVAVAPEQTSQVDRLMCAVARWNPGAASWLANEAISKRLSREAAPQPLKD